NLSDTLVPEPGTRTIHSAEGGGRTHTPFRAPDFESGASRRGGTPGSPTDPLLHGSGLANVPGPLGRHVGLRPQRETHRSTDPDAEGGGRTHTSFRTPDFESGASANSATSACEGMVAPSGSGLPARPSLAAA